MKSVAKTVKNNLNEGWINGVERPKNYTFEIVNKYNRFGYSIYEYDNTSFISDDDHYEYYYIIKKHNEIVCVIDDLLVTDIQDRKEFMEIIEEYKK